MPVVVIDTIKPKNNLTFPIVEDVDVLIKASGARLSEVVANMATSEQITALQNALAGKASIESVEALTQLVNGKASAADLQAVSAELAGKASQSDLETLSTAVADKASASDLAALDVEVDTKADAADLTTATANLQAQIDNIVSGSTADSEVINARVDSEGTSHATLKARIDSTENKLNNYMESTDDILLFNPENLFNPALQTSQTIDPHYYYNGAPYSTTEFDSKYNCSAPFPVKPNTTYTIGLAPAVLYQQSLIIKPWADSPQGLFFYDESMNYISKTSDNTFTTPANARYARFNYQIERNITLTSLQTSIMLVYGSSLPAAFIPYNTVVTAHDKINNLESDSEEKILDVKKLAVETETANKFTAQQSLTTGGYLAGGRVVSDELYGYTDYIEIEGGLEYIIGLVPVYGIASNPWMYCPVALEFYDSAKNYIGYVPKTTSSFKLPYNAKYIRVNACVGSGINTIILNARAMLVKGNALPESYTANIPTVYVKDSVSALKTNVAFINNQIHFVSDNLYNPSLQTSETISPHFYYNGVPYSTTELDNTYNCTALIEVEASTTYSIALVPSADGNSKPWWESGQGGFCYDSNGDYIASSMFTGNTFTTPANAKYIRFNYNLAHCPLNTLNERCVLVKGSTVPTQYVAYENCYIKEKIEEIENEIIPNPNLNYIIDQSGTGVTLIAKYSNEKDIAINLRKKGGNKLFDFYKFGLIPNTEKVVSKTLDNVTWFLTTDTDWFAPFIVAAKNNIDGDDDTHTFTGGNHQYNNEGSGSTATARGIALRFLADNMEVTSGAGGCRRFEMIWTNLVQGWNTKKSDGTGREILQENHRLIFDGNKFEAFVDLIPLEDVTMNKWYGLQWVFSPFANTRFIGAVNRMLYDSSTVGAISGDNKSNCVIGYGTDHEIKVSLDINYDLGDRKYYTGNQGIFTLTYGKGYYTIIEDTDLTALAKYSLHGYYEFYARKEVEADTE